MKVSAALAASTAILALMTIPAFAAETMTISSMMVADIGHDVTAVAQHGRKDAKIVSEVTPEWPMFEATTHLGGTTLVEINLDAKGTLLKTAILQSSGHPGLDRSALDAVRASKYAPESVDGSPIAGDYAIEVTFDPSE